MEENGISRGKGRNYDAGPSEQLFHQLEEMRNKLTTVHELNTYIFA